MNAPDPGTEPSWLASGFARHVAGWAEASGAREEAVRVVSHAARSLAIACAGGDVCIGLADVAAHPAWPVAAARQRALLEASGVVGSPAAPGSCPLILDEADRLYLHRYFDYERRLARRLVRLRSAPVELGSAVPVLRAQIEQLFAENARRLGEAPDWQRLAVAMALTRRFTVVSGGPGTGKTTMVVNLLGCLLALDPGTRIALAAPTGKAAGRMTEAIRARAGDLPETMRARLPHEAFTVHRLLGVLPDGGFVHHASNPLPIDVLILDEASMLDLALATRLLEAVPETGRVVMLGDKDQLAAVESGAVFSDLSANPALGVPCREALSSLSGTPLERIEPPRIGEVESPADTAIWFTRNFRFAEDSGIGRLAAAINAGRAGALVRWLRSSADPAVRWFPEDDAGESGLVERALASYTHYVDVVAADPRDRAAVTEAFGRFRLLCAVREGPRGVEALNESMTRALRPRLAGAGQAAAWYPGRPVMVRRNDYVLRLYNGDIGIALPDDAGELAVHFPQPGGGFRAVSPARLPEHETAFAMTVHKSQGSEFDEVSVVLPPRPSRVLTRELLYTAITRARSRVALIGAEPVLRAAVEARTRRRSGLATRLAESG